MLIKNLRRSASFLILLIFLLLQILPYMPTSIKNSPLLHTLKNASVFNPSAIDAIGLSSASATLSNPRLSFDAIVKTTIPIGGSIAETQTSGVGGDYDTRNLFPNDVILITGNSINSVASVSADLVTFLLTTPLSVAAAATTAHMTVAQSGTMTVSFYTAAPIPAGGSIKVSIPAPTASGNDGVPLSNTGIATNGFDTNGMTNANTTCPGGFTASTFTTGTGGAPHTFTCNNAGGSVPAGANISFVIGNTIGLVNPAPVQGRAAGQRGIADIYNIIASTHTGTAGSGSIVEDISMKTAPVEGVLVTAMVDETLQFTIAGVNAAAGTYCGKTHTAGLTTTATSVPWGLISSGYSIDKNEAVQQLIVTTNANSGYKVYAEENDQMGIEGAVCVGAGGPNSDDPTAGDYTFNGKSCIRDFAGGSNNALVDWLTTPAAVYGFGYAIQNNVGTDAGSNVYDNGGMAYGARAFTDMQNTNENKYASGAEVMSNAGPVSASAVYVCYRINIRGTQPAGYYYNKLKYTAVPKF